jgi:5'-3' exonuclease
LDRAAFVDFALLLGTDFSQRIKNLGPSNAYQLIRKHGTIEQILEAIETQPRYTLKVSRDVYLAQVQIAREVFGTLPPVPPASALESGKKSDEDITEIMQCHGPLKKAALDLVFRYAAIRGHADNGRCEGRSEMFLVFLPRMASPLNHLFTLVHNSRSFNPSDYEAIHK